MTHTTTPDGLSQHPANRIDPLKSDFPIKWRNTYPGRCGGFYAWAKELAQTLTEATPPDRTGILQHHGLWHFNWRGLTVRIAPHQQPGAMVVVLERNLKRPEWKQAHGRKQFVGFKARTWKRLQAAVALAFNSQIYTRSNGEDGQNNTSIMISTPAALRWIEGLVANYRAVPDCFRMTDDEKARLKAVDEWAKGVAEMVNRRCRPPYAEYHRIDAATAEVGAGPLKGQTITIKGRIYNPADYPAEQRADAFQAAITRIFNTAETYFPEGKQIGITLTPTPEK